MRLSLRLGLVVAALARAKSPLKLTRTARILWMASLLVLTQAALTYTAIAKPVGNTKLGKNALKGNTGSDNTAVGFQAMDPNAACTGAGTPNACCTDVGKGKCGNGGSDNNAVGSSALKSNVNGSFNNAHGRNALQASTGDQNNAFGDDAMFSNTTGSFNTAIGDDALNNVVDGNSNVAIGDEAGTSIVHASHSIAIGVPAAGPFADLDNTCFIGSIHSQPVSDPGTQQAVYVDQFNVVGIFNSSRRYKRDIQPMDKASDTLYRLKPVTFKFNSDWKGTTQYGLIAEEVAEVDPNLVAHDKDGEVASVHYEQINNMLLNEFLKEHKKVEEQQANIAELKSTVAQQQKGMEVLTAQLKELTAQIQEVSVQLEVSKSAAKVVLSKP
jgi:uncharacterized coiled-coil protein SlyX